MSSPLEKKRPSPTVTSAKPPPPAAAAWAAAEATEERREAVLAVAGEGEHEDAAALLQGAHRAGRFGGALSRDWCGAGGVCV
ncbi:unnamed protein product, partial [Urochloa humidicola]